jgi:hypothetical protein
VARTIYLGSAPTQKAANRGIEDNRVKLGCVQPGEAVATFGDALRRLTDRATHLYVDGRRYWYSTQPTVLRLADDRAAKLDPHNVIEEINRRLRDEARTRGDFTKVHPCPASGADVPDEPEARLVILSPEHSNGTKDPNSRARKEAAAILESRGSSPRNYRNAIVFLASDGTRLKELEQAVRHYLAWSSIVDDASGDTPSLNLDNFQMRQAQSKKKAADETIDARIPETYQWLLVPGQPDPKGAMEWCDVKLQGQDALAVRASKKMRNEEMLLTQMGGIRLRLELDKVPLWRGDHVLLKQLAEDFAKYLYLPRLRDADVLLGAVRDGLGRLMWQAETFAYAERWDEVSKQYGGLQAGQVMQVLLDGQSVLTKPDVAAKQLEASRKEREKAQPVTTGGTPSSSSIGSTQPIGGNGLTPGGSGGGTTVVVRPKLRRFHGSVELDKLRLGRDAGRIAEEVVQHLSGLSGVNVKVTLEIEADIPDGASDDLVRTITENCRTLKFESQGFEES